MIAQSSDDYLSIPLLWAALVAMLLPGAFMLAPVEMKYTAIYEIQVIAFIALALLFSWTPLKMRLVSHAVKHQRVERLAYEQFLKQGVHRTRQRNGVLLFVSVAERCVEIIADEGVNGVVAPGAWDKVVAEFVPRVQADQIAEGFIAAIGACGEILAQHFPIAPNDKEELPNHLIVI